MSHLVIKIMRLNHHNTSLVFPQQLQFHETVCVCVCMCTTYYTVQVYIGERLSYALM